ncbi:DUF3368 domain-containing protein [Halobacteriaceae archaeon SHR40]|uniref:DUF3368 domain-containing protein n=1 Tax=Halovenus amylolytica TaxID=2500550 RepID=UPI000FE41235
MSWVFDATPLIYLAKVERLGLIETLDGVCLVPEAVYQQVVTKGIEAGYTGARRIERRVEDGTLEAVEVEELPVADRLGRNPGLSRADVAVPACAHSRDGIAVTDEAVGRSAADVEGIETRGTAFVVLSAVSGGVITPEEGRTVIDSMIEQGWYVAPNLYTKILQKLEAIEE